MVGQGVGDSARFGESGGSPLPLTRGGSGGESRLLSRARGVGPLPQIGFLIGGTVVIETVFALPGLGGLILTTINQRDYPVIQTTVLFAALGFLLTNLVVDLSYRALYPRIRYV